MTMLVVLKRHDCIIMTADKRITTTNALTGEIQSIRDDYNKIKCIDKKYIISFAGRAFIAEEALKFIEQNLGRINERKPEILFSKAFSYGKSKFESKYKGVEPMTVFYLGYIQLDEPILLGFSSDNNYEPQEINFAIKAIISEKHKNPEKEAEFYINAEFEKQGAEKLPDIFFQAIKRTNDNMIGKTASTVILSKDSIKKGTHP